MKIRKEFKDFDGATAWKVVVEYVKGHKEITTVTGKTFDATFVGNCLFLKGGTPGTKRAERGEYLTGKDFIAAYDTVRGWDEINTDENSMFDFNRDFSAVCLCVGNQRCQLSESIE